jgi:hypothetical protein
MLTVTLTYDSQLVLTEQEATKLAINLTDQLQADSEILIADERLTADEAERVIRSIEKATKSVDWKIEGF